MTYKVYTGPTQVQGLAQYLRDRDVNVTLEGTEHVYVEADTAEAVQCHLPLGAGYRVQKV